MPAGDPTASVQPWLSTSEPEPLARAFGYVRLGPDAELGLLRQSRAIERVCRERGMALEGLLSDEPGSAGDPGPALRRALGRIVAGGRVAADALRAAGEHERRMLQERTRRGLDAAGQKGARPERPAVADRPEPETQLS
jgi:hypothetical protein